MGCTPEQDDECEDDEKPHSVTVGDFFIGKYAVTQELWVALMGENPSYFGGEDNLPVEDVSWNDVQTFIAKLNAMAGKKYRLPTEAEWEYAARGGSKSKGYKYSGSNTLGDVAWYVVNSGDRVSGEKEFYEMGMEPGENDYDEFIKSNKNRTHPVGTKKANELGIYDMSGNVLDWVSDWYDEYSSTAGTNPTGFRAFRGGGWYNTARYCRVSFRNYGSPDLRDGNLGFRLALSPQ
jgi:formylglycine-generating enzyme required for sulfatase activity